MLFPSTVIAVSELPSSQMTTPPPLLSVLCENVTLSVPPAPGAEKSNWLSGLLVNVDPVTLTVPSASISSLSSPSTATAFRAGDCRRAGRPSFSVSPRRPFLLAPCFHFP
jgi:hypothetical protein